VRLQNSIYSAARVTRCGYSDYFCHRFLPARTRNWEQNGTKRDGM